MRLNEQQLRNIVKSVMIEAGVLPPGEAPAQNQLHVFDFDDTLGQTKNACGVMLYKDGKPAHKNANDVKEWLKNYDIDEKDLLPPGIKKIPARDNAFAAYVSSSGLAKIQKVTPRDRQGATGQSTEDNAYKDGDNLLIDFTPSAATDIDTTKPIKSTINRLKAANRAGASTAVVTARIAAGEGTDFEGHKIHATNGADMKKWLNKFGAMPTDGVTGVVGKNKGKEILNKFVTGKNDPPEEIHFYDDLKKNTDEVTDAITSEAPEENLYVYGPGEFAHGEVDPKKPTKKYAAKKKERKEKSDEQKVEAKHATENSLLERWARIAGIR